MQVAKDTGLIVRLDHDSNEAWINPTLWHQMDYSLKCDVVSVAAVYFEETGSSRRLRAYFRDNYTGKELASYSRVGGVKIN